MLNVVIVGIGSVDSIQIFSLHGMVCKLLFKFLELDTKNVICGFDEYSFRFRNLLAH